MLKLVVAGRPEQELAGVENAPNQFVASIPDAESVNHIVVFLTQPLPDQFGAGVYFSFPTAAESSAMPNFLYLGFLSNSKPSAIYKIVKPKKTDLQAGGDAGTHAMPFALATAHHTTATVGISIEPISNLMSLQAPVSEASQKTTLEQYCGKMLDNFVNYVASFAVANPANPSEVYVPMKTINSWFENFRRKLDADPNFWKS